MAAIPCFLCVKELKKRTDKNGKPYFVCDPCGVQIFVRGQEGVANLAQLVKTIKEHDFEFRQHTHTLFRIQAILTEIRGVRKEMKTLDSLFDLFAGDREVKQKERTVKLLNKRIETLLAELEEIASRA
jgi:DNA-directed RNA polymerase subunit RPC12/RpoP